MEKTIFQKIADKEIPSTIEFENDEIIVIRDIAPNAPLHLLLIPKKPIKSVDDLSEQDAEVVGKIFLVAKDLARKFGVAESGYRVVTNIGNDGGQTVPHLHFHLLGGSPLGHMNDRSTSHTAAPRSGTLRDAGLLILLSLGLAVTFNTWMNPRQIPWIRPKHDTSIASDQDIDALIDRAGTDSVVTQIVPSDAAGTSGDSSASMAANTSSTQANTSVGTTATSTSTSTTSATTSTSTNTSSSSTSSTKTPCFVAAPGEVKEIGYDAFVRLLGVNCITLIDARNEGTYAKGHIGNAMNIYGAEVQMPQNIQRIATMPRDSYIVIYCDGGECELSHEVASVMKNFGFGPIFIYTGGWAEWSKRSKE